MKKSLLSALCLVSFAAFSAELKLNAFFTDHAVLQREKVVPVWGTAEPGASVTVAFAGQTKTAKADAKGAWRVNLDPMPACREGRDLVVTASDNPTIQQSNNPTILHDILVGEVWLAAGQSNMTSPIWNGSCLFEDHDGFMSIRMQRHDDIRYVKVAPKGCAKPTPQPKPLPWYRFRPEELISREGLIAERPLSAAAYHYAIELHHALDVPVAVIDTSLGGSPIEDWISAEGLASRGDLGVEAKKCSALWNGMIADFAPYAVRGVIWYQGCSNAGKPEKYCEKMHALYHGFRAAFETKDLPLLFVQLTLFDFEDRFRVQLEQAKFALEEPNAAMVTTTDVGEQCTIHPLHKRLIAHRLAYYAMNRCYGAGDPKVNVVYPVSCFTESNRLVVTFKNLKEGLKKDIWGNPIGLKIAGRDGVFKPARIVAPERCMNGVTIDHFKLESDRLVFESKDVKEPVAARYLRDDFQYGGLLYTGDAMPFSPFEIAVPKAVASFENGHVVLSFNEKGELGSIREKASGRELIGARLPFVEVRDAEGRRILPTGLKADGDVLRFAFEKGTAAVRLIPFKGGWTIETVACDVPGAERFIFGQVAPLCDNQMGLQSNAIVDDRSGVVLRGYTTAVDMGNLGKNRECFEPGGHITAVWLCRKAGFAGHRAGFAAGPYGKMTEMLREMAIAGDVPRTACGGPWSQGAEANRRSYLFATWMDKSSVDDWLRLMEKAGSRTMHLHAWWKSRGHYGVDPRCFPGGMDDILDVCRRARARGFHLGTHSLCSAVGFGDPFINPKWFDDFQTDAEYTLAKPYKRGDTEIYVNERPAKCQVRVLTGNTNGNFLRLGDDLLQYKDFTTEPPYRFTGIDMAYAPYGEEYIYDNAQAMRTTRSADENETRTSTKRRVLSRAEYPAGSRLSYLHHSILEFMPKPGSKLAAEVVKCLADFFNKAELEGFYYDGSETWNSRESIDQMRVETLKAFKQPKEGIVNGAATGEPFYWWFRSLAGSWDHTNYAPKRFIDKHINTFATAAKADFLQTDYGWWGIRGANATGRGYFPDEAEYFGCKCAAYDSTISIQGACPTDGPLDFSSDRQLTISGWWDRIRFARAFPDGLQARMRPLGDDNQYRLRQDAAGTWKVEPFASFTQSVSTPDFEKWRVDLPANRMLALRVESLYVADRLQPEKKARVMDGTMFGELKTEAAGGMKAELSHRTDRNLGETVKLVARNESAPKVKSWCRVVRRLPLKAALKPTGVSSVMVCGDGSGAIANFQLRIDRAYGSGVSENVVKLDFHGWRRVDFVLREKNMDLASQVDWPYEAKYSLSTPAASYCYSALNMPHTELSVYLNGIPKGRSASVEFAQWDLMPMKRGELGAGTTVTVNGTLLTVPFTLPSGDYAELSDGFWTHYAETGAPIERVPEKATASLKAGLNDFMLSPVGTAKDPYPRSEVTAFAFAAAESAMRPLTDDLRRLLDIEWELPAIYAPAKGLSGAYPVRVRPGETAKVGFEILGPAKNPSVNGQVMKVELKTAQDRILCEDGRTWKAVRIVAGDNDGDFRTKMSQRLPLGEGAFAAALPDAKGGTTVYTYASETSGSRVSFFKRYR